MPLEEPCGVTAVHRMEHHWELSLRHLGLPLSVSLAVRMLQRQNVHLFQL